jgi:large subunit ribosomal protein L32
LTTYYNLPTTLLEVNTFPTKALDFHFSTGSAILAFMVVRMRHTRAHTANRRSHHALKGMRFSKCPDCGTLKMSHVACPSCGKYKGQIVVDVVALAAKAEAKRKAKNAANIPGTEAKK